VIIGAGLALALLLWLLVTKTRMGALVRAGASNREMATAMGVDIKRLFTVVFGIGAGLCAVAGVLMGPLLAVQVGMGENILILAFVVIVIGGIGSIRGALVGALLSAWSTPSAAPCCRRSSASSCRRRWRAPPGRRWPRSRSTSSWRWCSRSRRRASSRRAG
jgi:branched-subunit amino acid ABC-type transport system permease component